MPKFLSCIATSVQLGHKRFPDRHERPQIKAWRCDLTALSRSHNFYFVACNDAIHVYQPRFPDQSIPGEPELVLHPPTSSPYLQPGIDPEDSHSITRLHVDYLGQEEIILVTCDDGDVIGYRTEEIQRVMIEQKRQSDCDVDFFLEQPVRTFLHRNVGASAWGLAIHNEARMIAISANTHKVTVVAYALTQPTEAHRCLSSSSDSGLEDCSDEEDLLDFPSPRRQDHTIILPAHHNVPSVSFDNSGDDPSGRWLSSCSINGETLIWDLHNPGKPVRTIRLGYCASVKDPTKAPKLNPGTCACLRPSNFPHAIWSTMFLDANTAYEDVSLQHLVPPLADHPLPHIRDIGKDRFPFTVMPRKPLAMIVPLNEPLAEEASSEMDVSETDSVASDFSEAMSISSLATTSIVDAQHSEDAEVMTSPLHGSSSASQLSVIPFESTEHTAEATAPSQIMPGSLHQAPHHTMGSAVNAFGPWFQPPAQEATTIVWDDIDADTDSDDELFVAPHLGVHAAFASMMQNTRAYCEVVTAFTHARQIKMSSPLLIVTKEDVHLYQRPLDYVGDHSDHIITLRHPLHPEDCQKPFTSIPGSHDRHCYTTQIPELGVFIIASPNGRAGVFSLNRAPDHSPGRPQFSFQLENILPFANSDDSKIWDVEGARLIGVAAGPVQGMLDKEETSGEQEDWSNRFEKKPGSRRWRVMMYYTDHTVLAFELGKRREGEVPEVDELIV